VLVLDAERMVGPLAFTACLVAGMLAAARHGGISLTVDAPRELGADASSADARVYTSEIRGRVHVWASSSELDPVLHVTNDRGDTLDDDDSGGGTTAFLALDVNPGDMLLLRVGANAREASGTVRLSVRELAETDATDAAVKASREALSELAAMQSDAKPEAFRERLARTVDELLRVPGAATSNAVHQALLSISDVAEAHVADAESLRIHRAVAGFYRACYPADGPQVLREELHLATALANSGHAAEALPLGFSIIAGLQHALPRGNVEVEFARGVTAQAYSSLGQLERARDMYRSIVDAFDRALPAEDIRRVDARSSLASVLYDLGSFEEARGLQESVLEEYKRRLPPEDPYTISAENNLAATLNALGDRQAALLLHRRVLEVRLRTLPEDHVEVAVARTSVAIGLVSIGDLAEAEDLAALALKGYAARFPEDHSEVEKARLDLAYVLDKRGEFARALPLLAKTLELHKEPLESAPLAFWRTQAELMVAREGVGDLEGARRAGESAVAIMSRFYSAGTPTILDQKNRIAGILARQGKAAEARELVLATALETQHFLADCASTMPARQAEAVESNWSPLVSDALSLLAEPALGASDRLNLEHAFALIESARGIGTTVMRCARALSANVNRDEIDAKRAAVREASARLSRLAADRGAASTLEDALRAKENAERAMRAAIANAAGGAASAPDVEAKSVAAALHEGEAAIGYWIYAHKTAPGTSEQRLLAMVVRRDGTLARVELGPLAAVESACANWRRVIANVGQTSRDETREIGESLRKLVIDPVRASAGPARRWIAALDGALHLVPLDALPDGDGCVGDHVAIVVRPVLWDLAHPSAPIAAGGAPVLLAIGGIDYDAGPSGPSDAHNATVPNDVARADASKSSAATGASTGPELARARLAALPETAQEVAAIRALFRDSHAEAARVEDLEGAAATKTALSSRAPRAFFLHLATHGFFAPSGAGAARGDALDEMSRGSRDWFSFEHELRGFAPMTLCGLALAGANARASDVSARGVITAEELGALDLERCELGVLSACDTNVGERVAGQGIASFQKALHAAGARTVVTSLWKVPDRAARDLMVAFYRNIWVEKMPKAEALWKAKRTLRDERAPLRDWAAWVLSGDAD
jgi:CHAT domain-containing protein